jgi:hypothetical protein
MFLSYGLSYTVIGQPGGISGFQYWLFSAEPAFKEELPLVAVVSFRLAGGFLHLLAGSLIIIEFLTVFFPRLSISHGLFALFFPLLFGFLALKPTVWSFLFGAGTCTSALSACGLGYSGQREHKYDQNGNQPGQLTSVIHYQQIYIFY